MLQVVLARHVAEFDQHRGHVGRLQHPEAGRFHRILVQPRDLLHVGDQRPGEMQRKRLGFALRQIDQDVGDVVGLGDRSMPAITSARFSSSASRAASASEAVSDSV